MKFGLWTEYGAMNSKPIFEAFAEGCRQEGHELVYNNLEVIQEELVVMVQMHM